jgi:hypothetical protein
MNNLMQPPQNPMQQGAQPPIPESDLMNAYQHNQAVSGAMSGLLAKPSIDAKDIYGSLSDLMNQGIVKPQMAATLSSQVPVDKKDVRSWLFQHYKTAVETGKSIADHMRQRGIQNG